ncbi:MAG: serine/threonine protein phosphatase [Sphingomonadales bacterium]|nr:serine/threonine protein phosphatase [Sphingomonadales bacterium]MDE2168262.1 serine/threonine protein phosphatase [Sphingomonadales bacterium]
MLKSLRNLLRPAAAPMPATLPPGQRVYAVGDIHGRADLFARLIKAIEQDDRQRGAMDTTVILLGDLIDRGPDSRGVLDLARVWGTRRPLRVLMGNHEEMLLKSLISLEAMRQFLRYGGQETVLSFDVDEEAFLTAPFEEVQAMLSARISPALLDFIRGFEASVRMGDYVFVHAGIRPGVPIEEQTTEDTRWIREPFLSSTQGHGAVIVHGHTITQDVEVRPNRLGIDTGAYLSGRLTALGLEGQERWLIEANQDDETGEIAVTTRPLSEA